jgi:hypothetical protein
MKSRNQLPKTRDWPVLLSPLAVSFLISAALSTAALAGNADWINLPGLPALNGQVNGAATDAAGNLYVGGTFTMAGTNVVNGIAKWNGSSWSALGSGINSGVGPMAVSGTNLYVCGQFSTAGGVPANNIAQWNGSSWSALGSGLNGIPYSIAVSGTNVYVGGNFSSAGGVPVNSIAQWNGSSWSALSSGVGGSVGPVIVYALAVSGTNLYAGGNFTTAGGAAANYIAQWNGNSWAALGSGIDYNGQYTVLSLAVCGTNLFAGGTFTSASGVAANAIAQWNGSSWSALGAGMTVAATGNPPFVQALAVWGANLYAGGNFYTAGGLGVDSIAQWNGSSWSPLGLGVTGDLPWVVALAVSGTNLYVGGSFANAGTNASRYIAVANLTPQSPPIEPGQMLISPLPDGNVQVSFLPLPDIFFNVSASTDLHTWTVLTNVTAGVGMVSFEDTQATNYPQRFYGVFPIR